MFGGLGFGEIILILFIVLLLFGAKRLPEMGRSLGASLREFKKGLKGEETEPPPPGDGQNNSHS